LRADLYALILYVSRRLTWQLPGLPFARAKAGEAALLRGFQRQVTSPMSLETIVIIVVIVLIVLFVLGYFGRGRMRG
jgi:hypothetical protein